MTRDLSGAVIAAGAVVGDSARASWLVRRTQALSAPAADLAAFLVIHPMHQIYCPSCHSWLRSSRSLNWKREQHLLIPRALVSSVHAASVDAVDAEEASGNFVEKADTG